jgi:hypothetical protein
VRALLVEGSDPRIEVGLEFLEARIELLAKRDAIELVEHGTLHFSFASSSAKSVS